MADIDKSKKQETLKRIIKDLHDGKDVKGVKKDFDKLIKNVSADEISEMENSLIAEGFPVEEVQRLCEVHVEVFKKELNKQKSQAKLPGHPVHTFMEENKELKKIINNIKTFMKKVVKNDQNAAMSFKNEFEKLKEVNFHYTRKENQLFPHLEKKNFLGPSKVMWGKHDEIRGILKKAEASFKAQNWKELNSIVNNLCKALSNMIFMEEKILFPASLSKLSLEDWIEIKNEEEEIGYAWITPGNLWDSNLAKQMDKNIKLSGNNEESKTIKKSGSIHINEGDLTLEQLNLMLTALPVEFSFVDENDEVRYYSAHEHRIFPRSPAVIGRKVQNCHPQKSVHVVNKIVENFKTKKKKNADFWINMNDKLIYIRYFPVYDNKGNYKGTIEVTQDVTEIKKLKGEKRLLD